jgi:DNA polymerase
LAREIAALDIFRRGEDIYCAMASEIYQRVITKKDKDERQLGKVAVLGLGYQMGASRFVDAAASYGITVNENFAKQVVATYRATFSRVPQLWADMESTALECVQTRQDVDCGSSVTWQWEPPFLYCRLPSGRRLAYPEPEIQARTLPWGKRTWSLTFMGVDPLSRKWKRQVTYGGMIVENIVQAIARDVMAEAMVRVEATGIYQPILSVHDELIAEADPTVGDIHEFERLVAQCPIWAEGCPIEAEGWNGARYRK